MKIRNQNGFHLIEFGLILLVLGVIGFVGFRVFNKDKIDPPQNNQSTDEQSSKTDNSETSKYIHWGFDGNNWAALGTAPECENPLTLGSPLADITKATARLNPGEIRGGDFKPHGGLALDGAASGKVDVLAMRDGYLFRGSRYLEGGEVQYILDFMDSCGVYYRYDHLFTLSDDVMKEVEKLPAAQVDDSRTHNFTEPVLFKKGAVVATEVGHKYNSNFGFDIGVYDVRQQNAASKTSQYQTNQLRISDKEQSFYAVCWWDLLPTQEKAHVKGLTGRGGKTGTSDYCQL